jgi:hypothetical protein
METTAFLLGHRDEIVEEAAEAIRHSHLRHYERTAPFELRRRVETVFDRLVESMDRRDLGPVVSHAEAMAMERFDAGFDLSEVQAAINAVEESVWARLVGGMPMDRLAEALGMVGTVLGAGKDALARTYVSLATRTHVPSLDLRAMFAGAAAG